MVLGHLGHLGHVDWHDPNDLIARAVPAENVARRGVRLGHLGQIVTPKKSLPKISL